MQQAPSRRWRHSLIQALAALGMALLWPATQAAADTLSLEPWSGRSPLYRINGYTLFETVAAWGDAGAGPILLSGDRSPQTRWTTTASVEITDSAPFIGRVHIADGLYFAECKRAACNLADPDVRWVLANEGFRFHIYIAERSYTENRVKYCQYHVGKNGALTGTGFGVWRCYDGEVGRMALPTGSPATVASRIYSIITNWR
jgi:hypothetical protein